MEEPIGFEGARRSDGDVMRKEMCEGEIYIFGDVNDRFKEKQDTKNFALKVAFLDWVGGWRLYFVSRRDSS